MQIQSIFGHVKADHLRWLIQRLAQFAHQGQVKENYQVMQKWIVNQDLHGLVETGASYWTRRRCPAALQFVSSRSQFHRVQNGRNASRAADDRINSPPVHLVNIVREFARLESVRCSTSPRDIRRLAKNVRITRRSNWNRCKLWKLVNSTRHRSWLVAFHGHLVPYLPN